MRKIALLILASTISVPAHAADYTEQLWSTVSVEWLEPALRGNDPQQANRARRHCGQWASFIDNAHERQQLYVRCLRAELPATHYRITDMTDPRAVQGRYPSPDNRNMLEFPHKGQ